MLDDYIINGDAIVCTGITTIVWCKDNNECVAKEIIATAQGLPCDKFISLNDCLKEVGYSGDGCVTVTIEDPLCGTIYQYGNYKEVGWVKHGTTKGYA